MHNPPTLETEPYFEALQRRPPGGRRLLANYDARSITVYQAFRREIGRYAAGHGRFGSAFSLSRMSWIKPSFLWMMYRSGWGTKKDQEVILAIRLSHQAFETILSRARSTGDRSELSGGGRGNPDVLVQWDPDRDAEGKPLPRRTIQLGMRGATLASYANEWIIGIEDLSRFVRDQRDLVDMNQLENLRIPLEQPYPLEDDPLARRLGVDV